MKRLLLEKKLPSPSRKQLIREFVKFCITELGLRKPLNCKIKFTNDKNATKTYADYNPNTNEIRLFMGDRSLADCMRSLAHELEHLRQNQNKELNAKSGEDGSPQENQANAKAGIILRRFTKLHPEILEK